MNSLDNTGQIFNDYDLITIWKNVSHAKYFIRSKEYLELLKGGRVEMHFINILDGKSTKNTYYFMRNGVRIEYGVCASDGIFIKKENSFKRV